METTTTRARMANPVRIIPEAMSPIVELLKAARGGGVPAKTLELVRLRASQINGCGFCVHGGSTTARKNGETDDRLFPLAAWRDTPYFTDAERAALALTEASTRLADRTDAVPDEIWNDASRHYDEKQLAALLLMIGLTNLFNRFNTVTRQMAGAWPT